MATAFPVGITGPIRSSYAYILSTNSVETVNDRGLSRRRRIGNGKSVELNLAFRFSQDDFNTFAQWWRDDIAYGTEVFTISLLNGYEYGSFDCRIKGAYSAKNLVGIWEVGFPVEVVSFPMATQSVMQDAIDNYSDLIFADDFHTLIHATLPEYL